MDAGVAVEDFLNTGRTGRRNAMADIADANIAQVSTAGMDFSFDKLSVGDSKCPTPDPSSKSSSSSGSGGKPEAKS